MIATIDFETTGLKAGEDEVLQVSIIDENYNVLLNAYCRPNNKDSWEDAQAVHGITPLMVANELPFERYVPTVLDILSKADKVIAYNAAFEDSYLKAYGIEVDPEKWIDPMIMFAEIYGEWNERRGSYKWQSLTKCATYYGYEFKEGGEVIFTDRSIEILQELGQQYKETPLFKKSRQDNPDWEGDANAGLLFVYMCERLTEAPSRIHTMIVCKLMIPLIWERLEKELQDTAAVADKKIEEDTAQGGLLSAT